MSVLQRGHVGMVLRHCANPLFVLCDALQNVYQKFVTRLATLLFQHDTAISVERDRKNNHNRNVDIDTITGLRNSPTPHISAEQVWLSSMQSRCAPKSDHVFDISLVCTCHP